MTSVALPGGVIADAVTLYDCDGNPASDLRFPIAQTNASLQQLVNTTSPLTMPSYRSSALEKTANPIGQPGRLKYIRGYNSLASTQYVFVLDQLILQANGTVTAGTCIDWFPVAASSRFKEEYKDVPFQNGLIVCCSTTLFPTLTLGAANCFFGIDLSY